jgi:hypothetical protein
MEVIFHLGMGKTGTSSLQAALGKSANRLKAQGVRYLGMWFDCLHPKFRGLEGMRTFLAANANQLQGRANEFADFIASDSADAGTTRYIMSNEHLFQRFDKMEPFFHRLRQRMRVSLIIYLRSPQSWLPSAFAQWGVQHKVKPGPIKPFIQEAPSLIRWYEPIRSWHEVFGDILTMRRYDKRVDVIADFAATAGLSLDPELSRLRASQRPDDAEILLRALFNDRFEGAMLPDRFDKLVFRPNRTRMKSIDEMIDICFNLQGIDELIGKQADLLGFIKEKAGIDFLGEGNANPPATNREALRSRLLDYLVEIVLSQAFLVQKLEKRLRALEAGKPPEPAEADEA